VGLSTLISHLRLVHELAKAERKRLYDAELTVEGHGFSAFLELETLSDTVHGIASSLVSRGSVNDPAKAQVELLTCDPFAKAPFLEWLESLADEYPHVCIEIELLDYLRLKTLELLSRWPT